MKKAQMSLEMIIGLLILLVVAVVVIKMFLSGMSGADDIGAKKKLQEMGFIGDCKSLCDKYKSTGSRATLAKYCYTKMEGDLNGDGLISKFQADTKVLDICEDSVYCFHMVPCETRDGKDIDWADCRKVVCESYKDVYPDNMDKVDNKVSSLFTLGSCDGIKRDENWIKLYFNNGDDKPCTKPPGEQFCIGEITDCEIRPSGSFSCYGSPGEDPSECRDTEFILVAATNNDEVIVVSPDDTIGSVDFSNWETDNVIGGTFQICNDFDETANPPFYNCNTATLTGGTCSQLGVFYTFSYDERPSCIISS